MRLFFQDEVLFNAPLLCSNRPTCSAGAQTDAHKENQHYMQLIFGVVRLRGAALHERKEKTREEAAAVL